MTWIKICGLTRFEDVVAVADCGADAIGLNLLERSARRISLDQAASLAAAAKTDVVLLTEGTVATALSAATRVGATAIQPYGTFAAETATAALAMGLDVYFPVGVGAKGVETRSTAVPLGARPLLDTAVLGVHGGTGRTFDWKRARDFDGAVIAGGLDADNVAAAIEAGQPWGVDASSRLEAADGIKDHGKVAAFVAAVRSADQAQGIR